jgi:predicted GIY-YIG superfamily endonuclease
MGILIPTSRTKSPQSRAVLMGCHASKPEARAFKVYVCTSLDKWYVGVTKKPIEIRLQEHLHGKTGASWTRLYPPLNITLHKEFATRREANVEETAHTLDLMRTHGIDNVRGGRYVATNLSWFDKECIEKDMAHNYSLCYKCSCEGHTSKNCPLPRSAEDLCNTPTRKGTLCRWPLRECPHHQQNS